jgi:hypothetical protein
MKRVHLEVIMLQIGCRMSDEQTVINIVTFFFFEACAFLTVVDPSRRHCLVRTSICPAAGAGRSIEIQVGDLRLL